MKIAMTLSLTVLLMPAVTLAGDAGSAPGVEQRPGSVWLHLPSVMARRVPTDRPLRLTLTDPQLGTTSIVGQPRLVLKNVLEIATSQQLAYLPGPGTKLAVSDASDAVGCGSAEFGIGCYLTGCIGTTYCLPGNGDGGFTCSCV